MASFQFLSRNSVRWDQQILGRGCLAIKMFQFLSRNSVRWDLIRRGVKAVVLGHVSIPQSEFCPLGLTTKSVTDTHAASFNSSVGILSVGTGYGGSEAYHENLVSIPQSEFCPLGLGAAEFGLVWAWMFQFLSRNSVRWDETKRGVVLNDAYVSIPQSEFCPLGQVLEGAHKSSS